MNAPDYDAVDAIFAAGTRHNEQIRRLTTVVAQLADRVTYLEDMLQVEHPPAPWIDVDTGGRL